MLFEDFIQKIVLPQITCLKRHGMVIEQSDDGISIIARCGENVTVYGEFFEKWKWSVYVDPAPGKYGYIEDVAKFQKDLAMAADFVQLHRNLEWYRLDPETGEVIMPPDGYEDVHTRHCDPQHCKYGYDGCPVVLGVKPGRPDQFLSEQITDERIYESFRQESDFDEPFLSEDDEDDLNNYGER